MLSHIQIAYHGAMALLMGLLIGLEREHSRQPDEPIFAGVRTFPIIALTGFLSALASQLGFVLALAVALGGVCALAVAAYLVRARGLHKGATTEFVAILTFIFGALTALGYLVPAATFAVATTLLLSFKAPLHQLAEKIQTEELYAILKFGVVSVIVLPLLPDRPYGPLAVLNPRLIWWMVVFVSAVSMLGYVFARILGARRGIALTGLLGGLASSTAVTMGLSEKARQAGPSVAPCFALGIVLACTVMFFRVLFLTVAIDPALAVKLVTPISLPIVAGIATATVLWVRKADEVESNFQIKNPMELGRAIQFALLFAVVLLVSKSAHQYFGSAGVYVASSLAGIADVDAITVSLARLTQEQILPVRTAGTAIVLASAVNTLVKGGLAMALGGRTFRRLIRPVLLALMVASLIACAWAARG